MRVSELEHVGQLLCIARGSGARFLFFARLLGEMDRRKKAIGQHHGKRMLLCFILFSAPLVIPVFDRQLRSDLAGFHAREHGAAISNSG